MKIIDHKAVTQYISDWIISYIQNYNKSLVIKYFDPKVSDALLLYICLEISRITQKKLYITTNLTQIPFITDNHNVVISYSQDYEHYNPYVHANIKAQLYDGVVLSSIDKSTRLYTRSYSKLEKLSDIFPFFDLNYSNICQIFDSFNFEDIQVLMRMPEDEVLLLEWCNYIEDQYGIITSDEAPNKHKRWPYFTTIQKSWIGRIHAREKKTRHKKITGPYPIICDKPHLVTGKF